MTFNLGCLQGLFGGELLEAAAYALCVIAEQSGSGASPEEREQVINVTAPSAGRLVLLGSSWA